jgi:hypothetical protein
MFLTQYYFRLALIGISVRAADATIKQKAIKNIDGMVPMLRPV